MQQARFVAAISLLLLTSCANTNRERSELFSGHERTYLTLSLAQNSQELYLLEKLHTQDASSAIESLQIELDARALWLTEILTDYERHPAVREKRNLIACHLDAIARYRERYGAQTKHPEIADMASQALRGAPKCECTSGEADQVASQRRPTSGCS